MVGIVNGFGFDVYKKNDQFVARHLLFPVCDIIYDTFTGNLFGKHTWSDFDRYILSFWWQANNHKADKDKLRSAYEKLIVFRPFRKSHRVIPVSLFISSFSIITKVRATNLSACSTFCSILKFKSYSWSWCFELFYSIIYMASKSRAANWLTTTKTCEQYLSGLRLTFRLCPHSMATEAKQMPRRDCIIWIFILLCINTIAIWTSKMMVLVPRQR